MKCPKCQYFSFDSGDRCRNCGYDFSLSRDVAPDDLPIQTGSEPLGPLSDLSLNADNAALPLFTRDDRKADVPLVTPGATPRAPLSVRRGTPSTGRPARPRRERSTPDAEPRLALDTADLTARQAASPAESAVDVQPRAQDTAPALDLPLDDAAAPAARLAAAAIDLLIIGGIDFGVVYFTLKVCHLPLSAAGMLPLAPLAAFFALLNGGYVSSFVATGGQTVGKMAAGLRVIPADPAAPNGERVTFGRAAVRAAGYVVSALPAGLGFLPAFIGRDRRALHDRLADTRVVKA